ncbi:unnamed protein product [Urochloa humidicola]
MPRQTLDPIQQRNSTQRRRFLPPAAGPAPSAPAPSAPPRAPSSPALVPLRSFPGRPHRRHPASAPGPSSPAPCPAAGRPSSVFSDRGLPRLRPRAPPLPGLDLRPVFSGPGPDPCGSDFERRLCPKRRSTSGTGPRPRAPHRLSPRTASPCPSPSKLNGGS